jgi:hypothetical protein
VDEDTPEDSRAPSMGAKSLCIPFEQPTGEHALKPGVTKCAQCGENAKVRSVLYHSFHGTVDMGGIALHFIRSFLLSFFISLQFTFDRLDEFDDT